MATRKVVVFLADTHGGHRLGLMMPGITLYEEGEDGDLVPYEPSLTRTQEYLWECYRADMARALEIAGGDEMIVFHNGDLTQGMKYKEQLVSTRIADQVIIAYHNIEPWLKIPNVTTLRLISGTGSHMLGESSSPILLAKMLEPAFPNKDVAVCYHDRPTVDGVIFDVAHHGPSSGIREWTQGNQLRYYTKSLVMHDVLRGRHPPHLVVRGHFHRLWPETVRVRINRVLLEFLLALEDGTARDGFQPVELDEIGVYSADIVLMPAYAWMGEYGRQATRSASTVSIGMVVAEVVDGKLRKPLHYLEREVDLRRRESL